MSDNSLVLSSNSKSNRNLIRNAANGAINIFTAAFDACIGLPVTTSVKSSIDIAGSFRNRSFFKKFTKFLDQSESLPEEVKEEYVKSLSKKDYERIRTFLLQVIDNAEEDAKAEAIGKIYKARLLNIVESENEMLRLCSIINRSFFDDLLHLDVYTQENGESYYITGNLLALGLLEDCGSVYDQQDDTWVWQSIGATKYKLNSLGIKLKNILRDL